MRTNTTISWLLITALVAPHAALGATRTHHTTTPQREALPATALGSLWGGEHPLAKIGGDYDYGSLTLRRTDGSCLGTNFPTLNPFVPVSTGVPCTNALPMLPSGQNLKVVIGGDAAFLDNGSSSPSFSVYVNGVRVPDSALGPNFHGQCPRISGTSGTATVSGQQLALYACSNGTIGDIDANSAVIQNSRLNQGFNSVTVLYAMVGAAFAAPGNDVDTRIVYKQ